MMKRLSRLTSIKQDQQGAAAMEMALFGIIIAVMIPAFMDFTNIIDAQVRLTGSMRAAQEYAVRNPDDTTGIENALTGASNLDPDDLSVTTSEFCECAQVGAVCETTCDDGSQPARYLSINATYNVDTNYSYTPLMPDPFAFGHSISVRVD